MGSDLDKIEDERLDLVNLHHRLLKVFNGAKRTCEGGASFSLKTFAEKEKWDEFEREITKLWKLHQKFERLEDRMLGIILRLGDGKFVMHYKVRNFFYQDYNIVFYPRYRAMPKDERLEDYYEQQRKHYEKMKARLFKEFESNKLVMEIGTTDLDDVPQEFWAGKVERPTGFSVSLGKEHGVMSKSTTQFLSDKRADHHLLLAENMRYRQDVRGWNQARKNIAVQIMYSAYRGRRQVRELLNKVMEEIGQFPKFATKQLVIPNERLTFYRGFTPKAKVNGKEFPYTEYNFLHQSHSLWARQVPVKWSMSSHTKGTPWLYKDDDADMLKWEKRREEGTWNKTRLRRLDKLSTEIGA
jgi:hypothetical protein